MQSHARLYVHAAAVRQPAYLVPLGLKPKGGSHAPKHAGRRGIVQTACTAVYSRMPGSFFMMTERLPGSPQFSAAAYKRTFSLQEFSFQTAGASAPLMLFRGFSSAMKLGPIDSGVLLQASRAACTQARTSTAAPSS